MRKIQSELSGTIKFAVNILRALAFLSLVASGVPDSVAGDYVPVDQLGAPMPRPRAKAFGGRPTAVSPDVSPKNPATVAASARAGSSPSKLFGTVEFQRPLSSLPGWLDVIRRNGAEPVFDSGRHFTKTMTWEKLKNGASGKSRMDQLRYINSFWNSWPYMEDQANWGVPDYWAIPAQFLKKSGDCEDYAIVKYFTLKELGFSPDKMRIVVLRDTVRNLPHAVLVVYLNDDAFVLDNLSNVVLSHSRLGNYSPQYSVNENGRWAHIKPKRK